MRRLPASPIGLRGQLSVHSSNRCSTSHGQVLKILLGLAASAGHGVSCLEQA